ncbi:MAG: hypothetical protein MPJ78_08665 [Hyphomicrobiaceae bacterium]|nr:hypothetical protein [Hyphomicrobiaceae bacterium]
MREVAKRVMAIKPSILLIPICIALAGCGSRLGGESTPAGEAAAPPPATPSQRAVQVAWTAANARYCAFGLNPQKLKSDYLNWERGQGASAETIQNLNSTYDKAFLTFYDKVKETPGYCSKAKIEEIRPEINRHLAGDYAPTKKIQEPEKVALPSPTSRAGDYSLEEALTPQDSR